MKWPFAKHKESINPVFDAEPLLRELQHHARSQDVPRLCQVLNLLHEAKKFEEPLVMSALRGAIDICARKDAIDALNITAHALSLSNDHPPFYYHTTCIAQPEFCHGLAAKALDLMEAIDLQAPTRQEQSRIGHAVTNCCRMIAESTEPNAAQTAKAEVYWAAAVKMLSRISPSQAFNAVAAAAIKPNNTPAPLRNAAFDSWENIIRRMARDDLRGALREVLAVGYKYRDDSQGATAFRDRARQVLQKL